MSDTTNALAVASNQEESKEVRYIPFGSDEEVKLNVWIVQNMVATPTKSGKKPNAVDCWKFMMLCKARHLNPFEADAVLTGYDMKDGSAKFSLITAHQVFLKRAEANQQFDGMESGVILLRDNNVLEEREGDLLLKGDVLVGGWAKVYRRDRSKPFYRRLTLSVFNTGYSRWEKDPAGMVVKCAEADSLRSAFPTHLGGLYITEETQSITPQEQIAAAPTLDTLTVPSVDVAVLAGQCYGAIGTKGGRARKQVDEDVVKMIRIGESHENILRHFCTKAGVEWPTKQKAPEVIMPERQTTTSGTVKSNGWTPISELFDAVLADQMYAVGKSKFNWDHKETDMQFQAFFATEVELNKAKLAFMRHLEMIGTGATVEEPTPKGEAKQASAPSDEYEKI